MIEINLYPFLSYLKKTNSEKVINMENEKILDNPLRTKEEKMEWINKKIEKQETMHKCILKCLNEIKRRIEKGEC
jgi:hypothetical protein